LPISVALGLAWLPPVPVAHGTPRASLAPDCYGIARRRWPEPAKQRAKRRAAFVGGGVFLLRSATGLGQR
jgi:hypothetical protein